MYAKFSYFFTLFFFLFVSYTMPVHAEVWPTDFLFGIDCQYADMHHKQRLHPTIAIAHDSLIVFPAYADTILLLRFNGTIERKLYHGIGAYPIKIEYNNAQNTIYYLVQVPNKNQLQLCTINSNGNILSTELWKSNFLKQWLNTVLGKNKKSTQVYNALRSIAKKNYNGFEPNALGSIHLYHGMMNNDTVFFKECFCFGASGHTCDFWVLSKNKISDFFCARNFKNLSDLPSTSRRCDPEQKSYYNFHKERGASSFAPLKNHNAYISIFEDYYDFYFFINRPAKE